MSDLTVLFDLDGTLTDSRAGITACLRHALGKLGRACPDDDALATYIGPPLRGTLSSLLDTKDSALIEEALAHYRTRYDDVGLFENQVYDGVPEMLDATARLRARHVRGHRQDAARGRPDRGALRPGPALRRRLRGGAGRAVRRQDGPARAPDRVEA